MLTSYKYNGQGLQIAQEIPGQLPVKLYYSGKQLLTQMQGDDSAMNIKGSYATLVRLNKSGSSTTKTLIISDHKATPIKRYDLSTTELEQAEYSAYGEQQKSQSPV
ncbi:MAG: hypothetical protein HRT35_00445 [Algicola sp.]|nr:hypothetical protein [Algicola sp.]